jgi:hypothetical protein
MHDSLHRERRRCRPPATGRDVTAKRPGHAPVSSQPRYRMQTLLVDTFQSQPFGAV